MTAPPNPNHKRRYQLDETTAPHPWRKRRHPISKALEPDLMWVRGIRDTQTREWHVQPRMKSADQFAEVRALNGLPPMTPQKVRGVLKKAGMDFSTTSTTRIPGWHRVSSGYKVWQSEDGAISVGYEFNHWAKERPYHKVLGPALKALQDAGLNPTQHDDGRIEL